MKKMLGLLLSGMLMVGMVGCSSSETEPVEEAREFAITDGQLYSDIETLENGRDYVIPVGKWKVTKTNDGNGPVQRIVITKEGTGNEYIDYDKSFELEVKEGERVHVSMVGEGMQLYFQEIK